MINNCTIIGRIANDLELKSTCGSIQRAYVRITLAVERKYINKTTGDKITDFISVVVWGKDATNLSKFQCKGSLIAINGSIQTSRYEKNGQTVYSTDIVSNDVQYLESKEITERRKGIVPNNAIETSYDNPFSNFISPVDISDDDLPF